MNWRNAASKVFLVALPLGLYSLIGVLLLPIYTRVLSSAEMGVVELINVGVAIFQIVCTFEIGQAMARFLPDVNSKVESLEVFNTALFLTLFGAVVGALGVYILGDWLFVLWGQDAKLFPATFAICIYLILIVLHRTFQLALIYANHQKIAAIINIAYVFLLAVGTIVTYVLDWLSLQVVYELQILAYATALFVGILQCDRVGLKMNFANISIAEVRRQFSFALPILGSSVAVFTLTYYDRLLMAGISSLDDLGIFGVASRLSSAVVFALLALGAGLTPLIYLNYKDKKFMQMVEIFFYAIAAIIFVVMIVLSFVGVPLVALVVTDKYSLAGRMLVPLIAVAFLSNTYRFFPGLDIALKTPTIAIINVFSCVVGLMLGYVLSYRWGVHGIIVSKIIASASMALLYLELGRRYVAPPRFSRVVVVLLIVFGFIVI
jgi:O-antigen/teichoic acid export membrane protein